MLKARIARLFAATMLFSAAGCGSDSNAEFSLRGQLDGAPFDATGVTATISNSVLLISGATSQNLVRVGVLVPATPGTVTFATDTTAVSFGDIANQNSQWSTIYGGNGSVTFTKTSPEEIAGTFSFVGRLKPGQTGSATRTVSSGSFVVRFE